MLWRRREELEWELGQVSEEEFLFTSNLEECREEPLVF